MKNSKEIVKASENQGLPSDQADFLSLHQTIIMCGSMASNALIEMAKNLKEMRDRKLYTAGGFNSFSEYVENAVGIKERQAYSYISIIENRDKIRKSFIKSPLQYFKQNTDNRDNIEFIHKLNNFILENMSDEHFSIENIASQFAMSRTNLNNKIKNITGITPNDYIKLIRLNKSAELLGSGKYRINEVCFLVGFNSPSYFSKCFYEHFGKLPKDFMQMDSE